MKSYASLARLGMAALVASALVIVGGGDAPGARAEGILGEPPPGMVPDLPIVPPPPPLPPTPACLPKEPPPPVVKINVRVPACNLPGKAIEYRLCVENCSTAEAHHVLLKNPLPANARFVRADPEPSALTPELQWQLGTIGGGACREVVLVLQPTNDEDVKNCTRVQFEHGICVTTRQAGYLPPVTPLPGVPGAPPVVMPPVPTEPNVAPKTPKPKAPTEPPATLSVTIDGQKRQYVNLASHYFITVTNAGKTRATNLLVSCVLPAQLKFERGTTGVRVVDGQAAWVLGDLEPGDRRTVELVARAQVEGAYCVQATARADRGATAQAEACTQFIGVSALHVGLSERDDPLVVGGRTSYVIVVRNQGSAPITNLNVRARIPAVLNVLDVRGGKWRLGEKAPQAQWVEIGPLDKLPALTSQTYEIFVEAKEPGATRVHVEVSADQLERGPVIEEESTTLFADQPSVTVIPLSRRNRSGGR